MSGVYLFLREKNLYAIDNIKNLTSCFENFRCYLCLFKVNNLNCFSFPKGLKRGKLHSEL